MISAIRTFTIQDGKLQEASQLAVKAANYANSIGGNVYIERNISGTANQLHIIDEYESLAAWESAMNTLPPDENLGEMRAEFNKLVVGSPTVRFVERIS